MKKIFTICCLIITFYATAVFPDGKHFARSYMANTMEKSELELEFLNTARIGKMSGFYYNYKPQFEVEYGVTDDLTASFYFNFEQTTVSGNSFENENFGFESNSLEFRYRLSEIGENFIDPALYFEFEYGGKIIAYEPKIILSKNYNNWNGVINISSEFERDIVNSSQKTNIELTGGVIYDVSSGFGFGIEFMNHRILNDIFGGQEGQATFLGPTFNYFGDEFNFTINIMRQISGSPISKNGMELLHHEVYEVKTILEIEL